jgi:uncharacterized protein (DUF2147 family)
MRSLFVIAFLLIAGTSGQAQSFSFNVGGQPIHISIHGRCNDPSCVSVSVPGYVEYGSPHFAPPRVHYGPPETEPDYAEYATPPHYGLPPREQRPRRKVHAAPKQLPKVAAIRDSASASTSAKRNIAPSQQPMPAIKSAPSKQAVPQLQTDAGTAPPSAPADTSTAPTRPPPALIIPPAATAEPAPAPDSTVPPTAATETAPEKSLPATAAAPQAASAPAPAPTTEQAPATPPVAAATTVKPTTESAPPSAQNPPATAKPSPTVMAALPPARQDIEERAKPVPAMPIGVWSSGEGNVRVEQCGRDLCGYATGGAHAGKMVLIHMRQTRNNHWSGQVKDVRSGQTYSGHMSMVGANALHIEGCALGGLVCGGRTLSRAR